MNEAVSALILNSLAGPGGTSAGDGTLVLEGSSECRPGDVLFPELCAPVKDGRLGSLTIALRAKCGPDSTLRVGHTDAIANREVIRGWDIRFGRHRHRTETVSCSFRTLDNDGQPVAVAQTVEAEDDFNRWVIAHDSEASQITIYCDGTMVVQSPVPRVWSGCSRWCHGARVGGGRHSRGR
jgi:hypothetical protein